MYDVDKGCYEISLNTTGEESLLGPSKLKFISKNRGNSLPGTSEQIFPSIGESRESESTEVTIPSEITPLIAPHPPQHSVFLLIIFEQILKAVATLYLAFGLVASVAFISRQIVINTVVANVSWNWIGILKGCLSIIVVILTIWYRVLLRGHSYFFERIQSENSVFFYTVIAITAAISWIYFLMMEFRNYAYWNNCAAFSDMVVPITQMLFIMSGVTAMSDIINNRITAAVTRKFYVIYKSAAILLFFNSINCLAFDLFDAESKYLQEFLSGGKNDIYCYKKNITGGFVRLMNEVGPFFQVFSSIFFISTIAILLKPIRQFCNFLNNFVNEERNFHSFIINKSLAPKNVPQYNSIIIAFAVLSCILSIICVPLDIMGKTEEHPNMKKIQISFNAIPVFLYILTIILSAFLLRVLYNNFPINKENTASSNDFIVVWISLFGQLVSCLKWIINSSQFINDILYNSSLYDSYDLPVHAMCITLFSISMLQSLVQAIALDFIINLKTNSFISKEAFQKISYAALILISTNIGFFINDWYLVSNYSSFTCFGNSFNQILWDLLRTIGDPLTLIFRGYSVLFLFRFFLKLRCN